MRWTILLLLIGLCGGEVHSQANPDPAVSHPVVCKKGGDVGPAGRCVPFDPNSPEDRKLIEKMSQTPPDIRSAPPVQPPPPPDPVTSLGPTNFQTPPLVTAPSSMSKPPTDVVLVPYCDLACFEAKSHQFDAPSTQPGQAPAGAGALWGISQAMRQRQARLATQQKQQQDSTRQNEQQDKDSDIDWLQKQNAADAADLAFMKQQNPQWERQQRDQQRLNAWRNRNPSGEELKALRADIRQSLKDQGLSPESADATGDTRGLSPQQLRNMWDEVCRSNHKEGDYIYFMGGMMCYQGADGLLHATPID